MKSQNACSGGGVCPAFEEGQAPIFHRIPKVGFTNINTKEYLIFNMVRNKPNAILTALH
jgi:large subunit ribosomal protein L15